MANRILIVDDDRLTATAIAASLVDLGHEVVGVAGTAADAEAQVSRLHPDLVLMDISLEADGDGIVAAQTIRAEYHVPVLFITGHADRETLLRAQASEPFGVVIKPFAGAELATAIDIAMQRLRLQDRVERSERLYQTLFEQLPVVTCTAEPDDLCDIQFISPQIDALTGFPPERWTHRPDFVRSLIDAADAERVHDVLGRCQREARAVESLEFRLGAADGRPRWVRFDARLVRDHAGRALCYNGVITDITERQRIEQVIAAQSRDAAIGRMAAVVAHEVNNPLAAIKARLHLLQLDCQSASPTGASLEVIAQQVDRIARTVRNLLAFSRPRQPGDRRTQRAAVQAGDVLRAVAALYEPRCRSLGLRLIVEIPAVLPPLSADSDQLQQALVNLLENACEAMVAGGGHRPEHAARASRDSRAIRVAAHADDAAMLLMVDDQGPGLGGEADRLFAPFYTTKTTGTGLGLTIARSICDDHGGTLIGENLPAGGSRFTIRLPIMPPPAPVAPLTSGASVVLGALGSG